MRIRQSACYANNLGARRHEQERALAPLWKCCNVFSAVVITAKRSADELFMHYFHKLSSASGGFASRHPLGIHLWNPLEDFCPQTPDLPTLGKNFFGRPWLTGTLFQSRGYAPKCVPRNPINLAVCRPLIARVAINSLLELGRSGDKGQLPDVLGNLKVMAWRKDRASDVWFILAVSTHRVTVRRHCS